MTRTTLFLVSACFFGTLRLQAFGQAVPSECQSAVRTFLNTPDEHGLVALDKSACWNVLGSSNINLNRLNNLVAMGHRWAAQYSAGHLKELDGGNLEDALRALGKFSDHDMEDLLMFASKGLLSKHELADAVTMLPLILSDDPRAQLSSLEARRQKILRVTRTDLQEQRAQALNALGESLSEIRSNQ